MKASLHAVLACTLLLLSACTGGDQATPGSPDAARNVSSQGSSRLPARTTQAKKGITPKIVDAKRGSETWFAVGPITAVEGQKGNGVVTMHAFDKGVFLVNLQANLPVPEKNRRYTAELMTTDNRTIPAGDLKPLAGDGRFALQYEATGDLRTKVSGIAILIRNSGDETGAGTRVAEGVAKERKR